MNKDSENKDVIEILTHSYNIYKIKISTYNAKANEHIKVRHKLIKDGLIKMKHVRKGF
jgi:hypothetical protein